MSSPTWTPDALSSETRALSGTSWRLVEAQHQVATLKLVDSLEEQALLEDLIEQTKAPLPPECRRLDYLLATPFRYGAPYPAGSRFRRPGMTPGVFYGSEAVSTAVAEMAFHRLLFFAESPKTPWPVNAGEYTAFAAAFATVRGLDLTQAPFGARRTTWTHPTEYGPCQDLADAARKAELAIIRYESARDPQKGANLALLTPSAFAAPAPTDRQTWRIRLGPTGAQALCDFPAQRFGFDRRTFAADPRVAKLVWDR